VIEVKCFLPSYSNSLATFVRLAQEQLAEKYIKRLGLTEGYLIIWDQKSNASKKQKTKLKDTSEPQAPLGESALFGRWTADVVDRVTIHTVVL
jgi:hypothetical protein